MPRIITDENRADLFFFLRLASIFTADMATERTVVRVKILGMEYRIEGESDPEHTRQVAQYVDDKMREVMGNLPTQSIQNITIIAAMEMADELLRMRQEKEMIRAEINNRTMRLLESIDRALLP
jgi:cell division protein ZapA